LLKADNKKGKDGMQDFAGDMLSDGDGDDGVW